MDVLLLQIEPQVKRFLREQMDPSNSARMVFHSFPSEGTSLPRKSRWDVIFIDRTAQDNVKLAEVVKNNQIEGLKILLTEPEHLHSAIEFWGTGIYSYFLKPINPALFQHVWQNALERINLSKRLTRLQKQQRQQREMALEHRDILEDLLMAHLKMQELEQEKTKFLAQTAHELGTPLTALNGYLTLLAKPETGPLNQLQLELLNCSLQSIRRLLRLSHSLMDLSVPAGQRAQLQLKEDNLPECLNRAVRELLPKAEEKKLKLEVQIDSPQNLPRLRFDFDRMQQVFANLIENAIKFTPEGGAIRLYCGPHFWDRRKAQEAIPSSAERRRAQREVINSAKVVVEDTGIGIPREHLQDIFREYVRATKGNGSSRGYGLGLAIANQIVSAHQGKIWAESEPGSGSRFSVLIPSGL